MKFLKKHSQVLILIGIVLGAYLLSFFWSSLLTPLIIRIGFGSMWSTLILSLLYFGGVTGLAVTGIKYAHLPLNLIGLSAGKTREAAWILACGWVILFAIFIPLSLNGMIGSNWDPITIIAQWFFIGMAEEIFFRSYLLNQLIIIIGVTQKTIGMVLPILSANFFFASFRLPYFISNSIISTKGIVWADLLSSLGVYFLLGIILSYLYLRSRNLLLVGLLHGGWVTQIGGDILQGSVYFLVFILILEGILFVRKRIDYKKKSEERKKALLIHHHRH